MITSDEGFQSIQCANFDVELRSSKMLGMLHLDPNSNQLPLSLPKGWWEGHLVPPLKLAAPHAALAVPAQQLYA